MGRFIHLFEETLDFEAVYNGDGYLEPWLSYTRIPKRIDYNKRTPSGDGYVNLGLSSGTLWAPTNFRANKPEDSGEFYAWAETESKPSYTWQTYKYGTENNLTKYNTSDGKTVLDASDDPIFAELGGGYGIPTKEQCQELISGTNQTWEVVNGVNGVRFTNKTDSTKSIFIPAAGYIEGTTKGDLNEWFIFWTKNLDTATKSNAWSCAGQLNHSAGSSWGNIMTYNLSREKGKPLRGVRVVGPSPEPWEEHDYIEVAGLAWATCNVGASSPTDYGNYYAWSEINTKTNYTSGSTYTGITPAAGTNITGDTRYDAAAANWGNGWRMPTSAEFQALLAAKTSTAITSTDYIINFSGGKQLIFPRAGIMDGRSISSEYAGAVSVYLADTGLNSQTGNYAPKCFLYWEASWGTLTGVMEAIGPYGGCSIRPVHAPKSNS